MRGRTRLPGVIDTLSDGYGVVNRHPWIVLFPILIDLFLWLGPQLSASRLISQALPLLQAGRVDRLQVQDAQLKELVELAEGFNLLSILAPTFVGIPSRMAAVGIRDPLHSVPVDSWLSVWWILVGGSLAGLLLGSLYYAAIAAGVRESGLAPLRLLGGALRGWTRVLGFLLLLVGLSLLLGLPMLFLLVGARLVSEPLMSLVASLLMTALVWVWIYLYFVPNAIFLSQVGPLQAIKQSVAVVRLGFWTALAIMLLIAVILAGMGRIWDFAEGLADPWGLGLGIVGNAYIASGLIAASMRFYRARIEFLKARAGTGSVYSEPAQPAGVNG